MYTVLAGDQCNADGNVVSSWHPAAVWGKGGARSVLSSRQAKVLSLASLAMLYLRLPWFKLAPCQSLNFRTLIAGIEVADAKGILRMKSSLTLLVLKTSTLIVSERDTYIYITISFSVYWGSVPAKNNRVLKAACAAVCRTNFGPLARLLPA